MKSLTYRLDLIENIEKIGGGLGKRANFNFKKWTNESFRIFHGAD